MRSFYFTGQEARLEEHFVVHRERDVDGKVLRKIREIGAGTTIELEGGNVDPGATTAREPLAIAPYATKRDSG